MKNQLKEKENENRNKWNNQDKELGRKITMLKGYASILVETLADWKEEKRKRKDQDMIEDDWQNEEITSFLLLVNMLRWM